MTYLNMSDVIRKIFKDAKQFCGTNDISNTQSTFQDTCNRRLSVIDLHLREFKTDNGKYAFTEEAADKLIKLAQFNMMHNLTNINKEKYDAIDLSKIKEFFAILEDLITMQFDGKKREMYLLKINALKIEIEINQEKKKILFEMFLGQDRDQEYMEMLESDLPKVFADIFSLKKYPYLTEMDRVTFSYELYTSLIDTITKHLSDIEIVNDVRNSDDEQLRKMDILEILTTY